MKINICTFGNVMLAYRNSVKLYYHSLQDLGHTVIVTEGQVLTGYLNLLLFHTIFDAATLDALLKSGATLGHIGTEMYNPAGFFHRPFQDAGEAARYRAFVQSCAVVISHFHDEAESYRALTDRVRYVPFGFNEKCLEVSRSDEKLLDVYFFGSVSNEPYRAEIFSRLRGAGLSIAYHENGGGDLARNSFVGVARTTLNLIHRRDTRHVSYRVPWLANNRICALSNRALDRENYLQFCKSYADDELVDGCRAYIARKRYHAEGDEMYECFKKFPMSAYLEEAFDRTLGVASHAA
ncbi:MAG TPA: hypothetical protein VMH36_18495 [Alphaproteobacteria bacterium]|nr:hypothetical protein [Alphaproteobacteria bacterium]